MPRGSCSSFPFSSHSAGGFRERSAFFAVTDSSEEPSDDSSASVMFHLSPSSLLYFCFDVLCLSIIHVCLCLASPGYYVSPSLESEGALKKKVAGLSFSLFYHLLQGSYKNTQLEPLLIDSCCSSSCQLLMSNHYS